jgi:diadenosine tetraphosphate (Ap4A) HIT family hydrolase
LTQESGVASVRSRRAFSAQCDACTLAQRVADGATRHADSYTAEDGDEDVVVVSAPSLVGLIVIPSRHVSGLGELPPPERAHVLAALRRISVSVGAKYHGAAPSVVVTTDPPTSEGHVGFQVVPRNRPRGFDS